MIFSCWQVLPTVRTILFPNLSYLQNRIYNVDSMTTADLLCAYWSLIIVMEAVRRFMGMNLFIFICVFIAYAF